MELSAEAIEVLDRIIGRDLYNLPVSHLIPNLYAFNQSGKAREKIL